MKLIKGNLYQLLRTSMIVSPKEVKDIKGVLEKCKVSVSIDENYMLDFFKELLINLRDIDYSKLTSETIKLIIEDLKKDYLKKVTEESKKVIQSQVVDRAVDLIELQKILNTIDRIIIKIDNLIKYLENEEKEKDFNCLPSCRL